MKYYTSKQVSELLGITTRTVYNWRKNGILKYHKITSKTIVYDEDSIKSIMEKKCEKKQN